MAIAVGYQWSPPNNDVLGYSASSQSPVADPSLFAKPDYGLVGRLRLKIPTS
ncbi:uncharacterized protein TrAFT101_008747 [Trichoderma asperellum]|uniref:uncharacterized protein n=1 Tax=Trichoderma asperellum TaxID=101201 RepID=UPI00331E527A|nr:hypothetical protein TrAFT101_008747 [Trichoderma asperellum]